MKHNIYVLCENKRKSEQVRNKALTNEHLGYIILITNKRSKKEADAMKKILLAFVLGAILSGGFTYMTVSASPEIYEKQIITVHTGDTLWNIAANWSGKDEDVREVIDRIQHENKLTDTNLYVGQKLVIPTRRGAADTVRQGNVVAAR